MDKISYALGLGIGQQLKSMGANDLSIDDFAQAIKDVLENIPSDKQEQVIEALKLYNEACLTVEEKEYD